MLLAISPLIGVGQTGGGGNDCSRCLAVDNDPCNGCGWFFPNNCDAILRVRIMVANLNEGQDIEKNAIYDLPDGYPLLYLEHYIDGALGVNLVNAFRYSHNAQTAGGLVPMFEQFVNIPFNIQDQCGDNPNGFMPDVLLKLITYDQFNNTILYPMHVYSAEDDIFSCLVFVETCNYCNNSLEVCPPTSGLPLYTVDEFISCDNCNAEPRDQYEEEDQQQLLSDRFTATPNPFQDVIDINYQFTGDKPAQIELLDVNGRVVYQKSIPLADQQGFLRIDANQLVNGIYYCRMISASSQKVVRLIKLN